MSGPLNSRPWRPTWLAIAFGLIFSFESPLMSEEKRPNVLMIVLDDLNDWVGCLKGHPQAKTPNIDRLAQRGLLFANAHVPAPVCNPSRTSVLIGKRPGTTGIYANNVIWHEAFPGVTSLPSHFKANGYRVMGGGKVYHHTPGFNRRSDWDEYFDQVFDGHYQSAMARGLDVKNFQWPRGFPLNGIGAVRRLEKPPRNANEFDWGPMDASDFEMGDGQMVAWANRILATPSNEPFLLTAGIFRPHLPFYAPRRFFEWYPLDQLVPPSIQEDDCNDLPTAGQAMAADRRGDYELVKREGQYASMLQAYLAGISYADALIGQLLESLDAGPHADNTIVVLWSDHGWHLGEKQRLHKFTLWERSTHVPWIVSVPGLTRSGSRCQKPVGLIDLFPTMIELCHLSSVEGLEGQSLVPLICDPTIPWDRPALTTHGQGNHALRSERWRYIRYADGGEELYDHHEDPNEWRNLAQSVANASVKAELSRWLPPKDVPPLGRGSRMPQKEN